MSQLVREAAGLPKQKPLAAVPEGTPRSVASSQDSGSARGSSATGTSFTRSLRELFAAGTYRQSAGEEESPPGRPFQWPSAKLHEKWGDYDYDEDLQEDLFLERVFYPMPVKNTFIHYNTEEKDSKEWLSSPAKMLLQSFHTKYPAHEEAHYQNRCRPCAYHLYKIDGCRQSADCPFCHLCKRGEIKKRKKDKARTMRLAREARQAAALAAAGESSPACKDTNGTSKTELAGDSDSDASDKSGSERGDEVCSSGA